MISSILQIILRTEDGFHQVIVESTASPGAAVKVQLYGPVDSV